jgi:hypothetical protein
MPTRWSGKKFLLTYSRVGTTEELHLDLDEVYASINQRKEVHKGLGCVELHEDDTPHLHLALEFKEKLNTTNARYFDIVNERGTWHPNFSTCDTWGKCVNYCRSPDKHAIWIQYWNCDADDAATSTPAEPKIDLFAVATSFAENRVEWVQFCFANNVPGFYCEAVWELLHEQDNTTTFNEPIAVGPTVPRTWDPKFRYLELPPDLADKPLVLCGPSGAGKSVWAVNKALERYETVLFINQVDDLRQFRSTIHKAIVFDEIRFTGDIRTGKGARPIESQIHIVDSDFPRTIYCRYKNARIPAKVPKIFTCTDFLPFTKDPQIERRIQIVSLYDDDKELWVSF